MSDASFFPLWLINELEAKGIPGVPTGGVWKAMSVKRYAKLEADGLVTKETVGASDAAECERWRMTERGMEVYGDMIERQAIEVQP